jgi:aspartate racemase
VDRGAEAVILGCTELPILLEATDSYPVGGKSIVVLDPTEILARRCVALAQHQVS